MVVNTVLDEVYIMGKVQHGMGWEAAASNLVIYVDEGRILGQDQKWVQDTLTITVAMFRRMGLETNL